MRGKPTKAGQCIQASNTSRALDSLADRAKVLHRQHVESWLECAGLLREARGLARHGEWLPFLDKAGIGQRTGQRMLRLADAGFKCDTVSRLGGIGAALDYLQSIRQAREVWQIAVDAAPDGERSAVIQSLPDGPLSTVAWLDFGHALADAANQDQVAAAWQLAPWIGRRPPG